MYLEKNLNTILKPLLKERVKMPGEGRWKQLGFAETFKALSDPVRRDILDLLRKESLSAGEIGSHFDMTGATISYHLRILKEAGLVEENRVKNYIYYELNTSVLEEIMAWLTDLRGDPAPTEDKTGYGKPDEASDL